MRLLAVHVSIFDLLESLKRRVIYAKVHESLGFDVRVITAAGSLCSELVMILELRHSCTDSRLFDLLRIVGVCLKIAARFIRTYSAIGFELRQTESSLVSVSTFDSHFRRVVLSI